MAARKKRPVLYEVFRPGSPTGDPALKPRPFRSARQPERRTSTDEHEGEVIRTTTISRSTTPSPVRHRRTLTISTSTLTILIAGMIVLLLISFAAGRRYELFHPSTFTQANLTLETDDEAETPASLVAATDQPVPAQSVTDQEGAQPRAPDPAPATPSQVTLQRGRHYVVVQHFNKDRQRPAALAAAAFLQENGVPCATLTGADIRLIATQGFLIKQTDAAAARAEQERANGLLARIRQLGQRYNRELLNEGKKGYTFSECYVQLIK